jgi:hypothetical protein
MWTRADCAKSNCLKPSGLPDDSREAEERAAAGTLRELGGRVKVARAVVAAKPKLAEALARDWRKAARFYARFGITSPQLRLGAAAVGTPGTRTCSHSWARIVIGSLKSGHGGPPASGKA